MASSISSKDSTSPALGVSTSAPARPVFSFEGSSYTESASAFSFLGTNLPFGGVVTVYPTPGVTVSHIISLDFNGTRAVVDGTSTQAISPLIPTSSPVITTKVTSAQTAAAPSSVSSSDGTEGKQSYSSTIFTSSTSSESTSTSTSSNTTANSHGSSSNGISPGASAGIGIGCAAAGALIAAVLIFFIFRKRGRSNRHDTGEFSPTDKSPSSFKQAETTTRSLDPGLTSGSSAFALAERDLPLPLEDAAIGGELSRLQTLIKNYAQSYYHTSPIATRNADPSDLGSNLPIPASRLAGMLADPRTRVAAIRFCLMWIITSRNALNSEPNQSLLPLEVINLLRLMPGASEPSSPPSFPPWRALTHRLLSPSSHPLPTTTTSPSSPTPNAASLQLARTTLDNIFQPYADPTRDSYERMSKLEGILERGARFGWMLFGQMNELGIEWMGEREQGRLVLVEREMGRAGRGGGLGKGGRVLWEGEQVRWGGVAELKGDDYVMET